MEITPAMRLVYKFFTDNRAIYYKWSTVLSEITETDHSRYTLFDALTELIKHNYILVRTMDGNIHYAFNCNNSKPLEKHILKIKINFGATANNI